MQQLGHDAAAIGRSNQQRGFGFQLAQGRQRISNTVLYDIFDNNYRWLHWGRTLEFEQISFAARGLQRTPAQ